MLDAFIIEELRRREQKQREAEDQERPRLELPVPGQEDRDGDRIDTEDEPSERGVTIIGMN